METHEWMMIILGGMNLGWVITIFVIVGINRRIGKIFNHLGELTRIITKLETCLKERTESLDKRVTRLEKRENGHHE